MQYYTFTSWQQVEDWIKTNNLVRWEFAAQRDSDGKTSQFVCKSDFYPGDFANKIEQTRKALEGQPGRYLYGSGWINENRTGGDASCEVMIQANNINGIGGFPMILGMQQMQQMQQAQPIGDVERQKIIDDTRRLVMDEIDRKNYEKEKAEFEKEKKEYEAAKSDALGILIGYVQPYLPMLKEKLMPSRMVAGVDSTQPIIAAPVQPVEDPQGAAPAADPDQEQSPFADAEAEQLMSLMIRFKKVEPDYIKLLAAVVEMAEKGDATYNMAKGFLMK